jgi:hypothetical protein
MSTGRFLVRAKRFQPIILIWSPTDQINQCEVTDVKQHNTRAKGKGKQLMRLTAAHTKQNKQAPS